MSLVGFVALIVFALQMLPGLSRALKERKFNAPVERHLGLRVRVQIQPPITVANALDSLQVLTATEELPGGVPIYVDAIDRPRTPEDTAYNRRMGDWLTSPLEVELSDRPAREILQVILARGGLVYRMDYGKILIASPERLRQLPKVEPWWRHDYR